MKKRIISMFIAVTMIVTALTAVTVFANPDTGMEEQEIFIPEEYGEWLEEQNKFPADVSYIIDVNLELIDPNRNYSGTRLSVIAPSDHEIFPFTAQSDSLRSSKGEFGWAILHYDTNPVSKRFFTVDVPFTHIIIRCFSEMDGFAAPVANCKIPVSFTKIEDSSKVIYKAEIIGTITRNGDDFIFASTASNTTTPPMPPFTPAIAAGNPDIGDALEILMFLAGLPNTVNVSGGTPPTINDVLEVLMKLAGLPSVFDKK